MDDVPKITVREMYEAEIKKAWKHLEDPTLATEREKWRDQIKALKIKMKSMSDDQLDRNAMEF